MASTPLTPQPIRNIGIYGVIRESEVDGGLVPDGAVSEVKNFHFDRKGAATVRPGIAVLGATIATGYPLWGLHNTQSGSIMAVVSQGGTSRIYAFAGSSWASSLTGGTANVKIRFIEAAGRTVVLNFGNASNMYSSVHFLNTSDSWVTTGNPINPQALTDQVSGSPQPIFGEVFKSRLYLAGGNTNGTQINNSRILFSNIITSAGNFTWDVTNNFVDINPNDGENITALKRFSQELLIFKPNYIYRFRTTSTDPDPLIRVGTRSQESVIEGSRGLYFHHDSGFYRYSGGYPINISRAISDFVSAIPFNYRDDISSWRDEDHIYWSVGDLTVNGESWLNTVFRYTESSEIWTVYSYAFEPLFGSDYNSGSSLTRVVGLNNGVVATINSGTTDLGEPIKYKLITNWYEFGGIAYKKVLRTILGLCEKAQGLILQYRSDEDPEWKTIGQLRKFYNLFENKSIVGHRIKFQISGSSRDESAIFQGLEVLEGFNEGIVE